MSRTQARAIAAIVALAVVGSFVGGAGAATSADVTLTVTVVDQQGNPLSDAQLNATWDGGDAEATTASNGKAFVDVEEGADVTIRVDHANYVRNVPYVVENAGQQDVEIDLARIGSATAVVENATGRVDNAIVRLYHDGNKVVDTRTNADGEYTTGEIEQGEYTLIAYKEGYLRNTTTLTVDGQVTQRIAIEQDSVLVTFDVTDDHFEQPRALQNANVSIPGHIDVQTQGNGEVTVSIPVNDIYQVTIDKQGYDSVTERLRVHEDRTSLSANIQRIPSISAETDARRIVVGETVDVTVTDEYSEPVAGAAISLDGSSVGETDENGEIRVPIESQGNHTISASIDGLETSVTVEGVEPAPDDTPTPTDTPTATETSTPTDTPTAAPTDTPTVTETTGDDGPGFGVVAGVAALLAVGAVARRRR